MSTTRSPLPSSSFAPFAVETVEQAAKNLKAHIMRQQQDKREEYIADVMKKRRINTSLFKRRAVTRQEAEYIVDHEVTDTWGDRRFHWENSGSSWATLADELLAACKHAREHTVYLSVADAATVEQFVNWKPAVKTQC